MWTFRHKGCRQSVISMPGLGVLNPGTPTKESASEAKELESHSCRL